MLDAEDSKNCKAVFKDLCEKYPPKDNKEKNGLAFMALMMGSKDGMWDVVPLRPFSYNAPYFGVDDAK